jgi:CheY-like chemotaxis protein
MPDMDGLELARVMDSDPILSRTKKIMLTSLGLRLESRVMHEAGISECLLKPAKKARLLECLNRVIDGAFPGAEFQKPFDKACDPIPAKNPLHGPMRILLAEDNRVNQKVVVAQLRKLGYQADIAANGLEALKASERTHYDVIFMDCHMPEMGGYEASRKFRERTLTADDDAKSRTHIVALTANAMEGDREKCLAAGMDDYLSKPTRIDDLDAALAKVEGARIGRLADAK